ncbi:MAG: hypothetical protein N2C12_01930, partial [Planctomycetales bacterium]
YFLKVGYSMGSKRKLRIPKAPERVSKSVLWLYALTIFLGAFLLFQIQPLISKTILPWFGGSAGVWTTCMLFFQLLLFLGYAYAHYTTSHLSPRNQGILHAGLLVLALVLLQIRPGIEWQPDGDADPIMGILLLLVVHVGLPFFLLSATSPLIQVWWDSAAGTPYRLYALSNVGSLLALATYPFVFERLIPLSTQATAWSVMFVAQAILLITTGRLYWWRGRVEKRREGKQQSAEKITMGRRLLWIGLAAAGSIMLLATTSHISHDVAVVPLLWIMPLSLYLLTFIICFSGWRVPRWTFIFLMLGVTSYLAFDMAGATVMFNEDSKVSLVEVTGLVTNYIGALFVYLLAMFACCMVCHGELWRLKPESSQLTAFYLYIALGGALGGVGCGILAPLFFPAYWELSIGIAMVWALLIASLLTTYSVNDPRPLVRWSLLSLLLGFGLLCFTFVHGALSIPDNQLDRLRNFYGVLKVESWKQDSPEDDFIWLVNGLVAHGKQYTDPARRKQPTMYYCEDSGVGMALEQTSGLKNRRIGVVGVGVGTVAAYARTTDYFRFYELNPDVIYLARKHFYYLADLDEAQIDNDQVMGDARNSLQRELNEQQKHDFDVLVLDAFNSDSVPLHLLTREMFDIYLPHMRNESGRQGIIAVHISNNYLDLLPIMQAITNEFGLDMVRVESDKDESRLADISTWVLLSRPGGLNAIKKEYAGQTLSNGNLKITTPDVKPLTAYTDDFINLPSLLKPPWKRSQAVDQ